MIFGHGKPKHQLVFNMQAHEPWQRWKAQFRWILHHAYDIYNSYIEFQTRGDDVPSAEEKFDELDLAFYFDRYKSCNSPTPLDFDTKMSLGHSPNKVL